MIEYAGASRTHIAMLDAMIERAEAACERYRQAAVQPHLHPQTARARHQTLQQMEMSLSRLRAQRLAALPPDWLEPA